MGSYYSKEQKDEWIRITSESSDLLRSSKIVTKHRSHSVHPLDHRLKSYTFIGVCLMKPRRVIPKFVGITSCRRVLMFGIEDE